MPFSMTGGHSQQEIFHNTQLTLVTYVRETMAPRPSAYPIARLKKSVPS